MSGVKFNPSGFLDVATDPSDLPFEVSGKTAVSSALTRCTNLHQDRAGVVSTRYGSAKIGAAAVATPVHRIVEMDGDRYVFGGTQIYKNEVSIGTGYTSAKWSAIKYNAYNSTDKSIFAINGTDRVKITNGVVYQWGLGSPATAPTLRGDWNLQGINLYAHTHSWEWEESWDTFRAFQAYSTTHQYIYDWESDVLAGSQLEQSNDTAYGMTYWFERAVGYDSQRIGVEYTYVVKSGDTVISESSPSGATYIDADEALHLTMSVSSDPQVTHIRIYRTLADGTDFYLAETIPAATTYITQLQDGELGAEASTDHDRPPLGTVVAGPDFNGYCFIIKDNKLYYCKPQQPEYWPALYYLEVSPLQETLLGMVLYGGQVYVLTKSDIYLIQGTGYNSFFPIRQTAFTGALAQDGILALRGKGILRVANDGLWGFTGTSDDNMTNARFRPIFVGTTVGSIPGINRTYASNSWVISWRNKIYHGFPGTGETYPGQILVTDLSTGKTQHYDYGADFATVTIDITNDRILAGDSSGYIWELEDSDLVSDAGTTIAWDYQSAEVSDQVRQFFPRSAKYDVTVGGTATAYIMLDGASAQSHTLSGSRSTTKRLVNTCTGKRLQCRIAGTGAVSIWAAELE